MKGVWGKRFPFLARNTTHQKKKMSLEDLKQYRDDLGVNVADENLENDPFHEFEEDRIHLHIFTKEGIIGRISS
ncbi:MAG: hypothetical protein Ct9H90mP14_4060 [Methanobacteriota archaeon]|nr:MAG: hypothetical protein Ct9H90mP14_4060 [Euryarchaeota archaeon]